jgi:hypothetical protein
VYDINDVEKIPTAAPELKPGPGSISSSVGMLMICTKSYSTAFVNHTGNTTFYHL